MRCTFIVCERLTAPVLLGCEFNDKFVEAIYPRRKLVELDDGTKIPIVRKPAMRAANAPSVGAGMCSGSQEDLFEAQGASRCRNSSEHPDLGIRHKRTDRTLGSRGEPAVICEASDLPLQRDGTHRPFARVQGPRGERFFRQQEVFEEPSRGIRHSPSAGDGAHGDAVGRGSSRGILRGDLPSTGCEAPSRGHLLSRATPSVGCGSPRSPAGARAWAGSHLARAVRGSVGWKVG